MKSKVAVVPCSGIGKSLGAVAREAAYILTEDLRPDQTKIVALALLVLGDPETRKEVEGADAVAIDGCQLGCAAKGLEAAGASRIHKVAVFEVARTHRGLKPKGVCDLNEDGLSLARSSADEGAKIIDEVEGKESHA